jgi:hypothetical protein
MLGNDYFGDCVAVAWANMRRFLSALLGDEENYPTQDQVYEVYRTQNPHFVPNPSNPVEDNGMDEQVMLEYLVKQGGPDGVKALAFARVDLTNKEEVKAALYIFGGLLLGFDVQNANMSDFDAGRPWDYHKNSPIVGGHGVLTGGYMGASANDMRFITWAEETGFTDAFWDKIVANSDGEGWVVIWPENLGTKQFVEGIDYDQLAADYEALTGNTLPPNPNPDPEPPNPEPPTPPAPPEPTFWEKVWAFILAIMKAIFG